MFHTQEQPRKVIASNFSKLILPVSLFRRYSCWLAKNWFRGYSITWLCSYVLHNFYFYRIPYFTSPPCNVFLSRICLWFSWAWSESLSCILFPVSVSIFFFFHKITEISHFSWWISRVKFDAFRWKTWEKTTTKLRVETKIEESYSNQKLNIG